MPRGALNVITVADRWIIRSGLDPGSDRSLKIRTFCPSDPLLMTIFGITSNQTAHFADI